jgi:aminopeptidase N
MSAFLKAASLALAGLLFASPAAAIDPFFPTFGNNGIDVIHYHLGLDVKPATGRIDAEAALVIRAEDRLPSFTLDLHGLNVSRVHVNGIAARFGQGDDKLRITPRWPIPNGRLFFVKVSYGGVPDPIEDPTAPGFGLDLGWFRFGQASYVVSEPVGASTFYPANDEPTDKASFTVALSVPADFTGVANGVPLWKKERGGKEYSLWVMRQPMTTWLATVHVNRFRLNLTRAPDGTPIRVYYTAETPPEDVRGYALAGPMIPFLERLVGPYPFAGYGSVVVDDPVLYYALETQAMSTFPLGTADEATVVHELAHQWFGNSVSIAKWEDLWIAEGSATYFEVLWPNRNDPTAFRNAMLGYYADLVENGVGPAVVESPEEMFTDRTYLRGALALYALRLEVGASTFYRILRTFTSVYRDRNATSQDFIRTAVRVSGRPSVRSLLTAWLYEQAVPELPGSPTLSAKRAPSKLVMGQRCGRGSHRGAPAACSAASGR